MPPIAVEAADFLSVCHIPSTQGRLGSAERCNILQAWSAMIFPLVQDFADALAAMPREHPRHRILKLLDEAFRRDVHFIDRHPTTFFQCMWNTCWWYDCPEAAGHYESSSDEPWERREPRLSSLLAGWRRDRE